MEKKLVHKTFYLTSLFSDIKARSVWSAHEAKLAMLLISKLNKYKIFLPDFDDIENLDYELNKKIKEVPQEYFITRDKFIEITKVSSSVASREIKKTVKGLLGKTMIMPHPLEKQDSMSISGVTWFNEIEYSNKYGEIRIKINEKAIIRLVAFAKYSKISFDNIIKIRNHNSIHSYLFFKILRDSSNCNEFNVGITDFKEKMGLKDKYKEIKHFKIYVLDTIRKEINKYTEINLDYQLIKEGRAFTKIKFTFDYKPGYLKQSQNNIFDDGMNNEYESDFEFPFEKILISWGIRAKKVAEIVDHYSYDVIQSSIDLTLEKEQAGEIHNTKAAIFLGILKNQQNVSDETFVREQIAARKKQEKEYQQELGRQYDSIEEFFLHNSEDISRYLAAKSAEADYPLSEDIKENLKNLSCVDIEKFNGFRAHLPVLREGYFDISLNKKILPNMYELLRIISYYISI